MTANDSKTKTYIKFDGKDGQKFCKWALKVKAMGARQGWLDRLLKDMTLDRKSMDKAEETKVLMNDLAYHYLVMLCTDYAFDYVQASSGRGRLLWRCLEGMEEPLCPLRQSDSR